MEDVYVIVNNSDNHVVGVFEDHEEAIETVNELSDMTQNHYKMYIVDFYGRINL